MKRTSYISFQPYNKQFMSTDEVTDRRIAWGVILIKMSLYVIIPQLAIDHQAKERHQEDLTLKAFQNNHS